LKIEKTYQEEEHQVKAMVELEQEVFDKAKHLAMKELSKDLKIPGFRPGKVPYHKVVQYVGEERIINTALTNLLEDLYHDIVDELD